MWFKSPKGLVEPFSCKNIKWSTAIPLIKNGNTKCREKNRFNVGWPTENPPHTHSTILGPK